MPNLLPLLVATHVGLALTLLVPSVLLPFALRRRVPTDRPTGRFLRGLLALEANGTTWIGIGLAITGVGLLGVLGVGLLAQPWLLVALAIYAVSLVLAFFIQRPSLRWLLGARRASDETVWTARARRQRYLSYLMAGLIGTVGFLMSTKPVLW